MAETIDKGLDEANEGPNAIVEGLDWAKEGLDGIVEGLNGAQEGSDGIVEGKKSTFDGIFLVAASSGLLSESMPVAVPSPGHVLLR